MDTGDCRRWSLDLMLYLEMTGLDTYCGIRLRDVVGPGTERFTTWRAGGGWVARRRLTDAMLPAFAARPTVIKRWSVSFARGPRPAAALRSTIGRQAAPAATILLSWRVKRSRRNRTRLGPSVDPVWRHGPTALYDTILKFNIEKPHARRHR